MPAIVHGSATEPLSVANCHPPQFSGITPPLVLRMAVIMPPSNPLALAWEPATVNIPNAAWVLVMLHAPVRPSSGVGPGVAAATPAPAPPAASVRAVTSRVVRTLIWFSFLSKSNLYSGGAKLGSIRFITWNLSAVGRARERQDEQQHGAHRCQLWHRHAPSN